MHHDTIKLLVCAATILLADSGSLRADDQRYDLIPRLEAGKVVYVERVSELTQKTGASAFGPERTTNTTNIRTVRRDIERSGDLAQLTYTFDRVSIDTQTFFGRRAADSDAGLEPTGGRPNPIANIAGPMIDKSFTVTVDRHGRVTGTDGMRDIFNAVEEKAAGNFIFEPMMAEFTDNGARFNWGDSLFAVFPEKPVAIGDTWERTVHRHDLYLGDLAFHYKCKLDDIVKEDDQKVAKITFDGRIERPDDGRAGVRSINITFAFKEGSFEGTADYDLAAGQVVKQVTNSEMSLAARLPAKPGDEAEPFPVDQSLTETVTLMTGKEREVQKRENLASAKERQAEEAKQRAEAEKKRAEEAAGQEQTKDDDTERNQ